MLEYVITDNEYEKLSVVQIGRTFDVVEHLKLIDHTVHVMLNHDEAKKLAAFIMAQVKE